MTNHKTTESIIQENGTYCFVCGKPAVHTHHCLHGTRRNKADMYGLTVRLCWECHEGSKGVHNNHALDLALERVAQTRFENKYGHEKWMEEFGKSYL